MWFSTLALISLLYSCSIAAVILPQVGAPINTTSGIIFGAASKYAKDVSAYIGIPYAQPPIDSKRWLAPEPLVSHKTFQATKPTPDCPGTLPLGRDGFSFGVAPNEDCLTLNVWAKPYKEGDPLKPVMVWIYGGAFIGGSAGMELTDGSLLASKQDVVVVAMNYRLSVMGFPGAPGLPDQNLGILDQRMAVEWARSNSQNFGGDPNKIVLVSRRFLSCSTFTYADTDSC
jgi:cholinesterase